jgi:hypothetical protein
MSNLNDRAGTAIDGLIQAPLGRRSVMRRMAALSVAPVVAGSGILGFAGAASAATGTDPRLNANRLRYAIRGGKIIDGYFAAPRGKSNLGVVVVIHDEDGLDAKAEETARRYALAGYYAIAPDLPATFKSGSRDAMIADMMKTVPNLKRFAQGNGKVSVVAA